MCLCTEASLSYVPMAFAKRSLIRALSLLVRGGEDSVFAAYDGSRPYLAYLASVGLFIVFPLLFVMASRPD